MKKLAVVLSTLLLVTLMAGPAPAFASETELTFTFVLPMVPNEIWVVAKDGFEDACAKYGVKPVVVMPSVPNDINQMNMLIETAIAEGTDGVMTQAVNPAGMAPAFQNLKDAGIPLSLVSSEAADSGRIVLVGTGGELGRVAGEYIVEQMGDQEIRYITALWALEAELAISIHSNYTAALAKAPGGAKELVILETKSDQLHITSEYQNAFATYPDANLSINVCGFGAAGAAKAAEEAGIGPDQIFIMGVDDIQETLDQIRAGRIQATMTQNFYRMGYEAARYLYEYVTAGTLPENDVVDAGTMVVNIDNIETYMVDMRDPAAW